MKTWPAHNEKNRRAPDGGFLRNATLARPRTHTAECNMAEKDQCHSVKEDVR